MDEPDHHHRIDKPSPQFVARVTHLSLQVDPAGKLRSEVQREMRARTHLQLGYAFAYRSRLRLDATIST